MSILSKIKSFGRAVSNKIKEYSLSVSNVRVKYMLKNKRTLSTADFQPGNLVFTTYDAKDKTQTYDRTPLALILARGSTHTLVLNFHWAPLGMRINLIKLIILSNENNIKKNKRLEFSYQDLKPHLRALGFAPVIRLYINKRIGRVGVVIPPERLLDAARLKTESFTQGKYSANQLYAKASKRK